jgi:hypothetical protein
MIENQDLGESLYKTWSKTLRRDEIAKLVVGYRSGLPIGILCSMTEAIAGSRKQARKHLHAMLTPEERQTAVETETGGMKMLLEEFLL